jgi:hypothetical protein
VVAQLRVPAREAGARLRLLDLRLGYTPQEMKSAEVVRLAFEVEFADEQAVERSPVNHEVLKAVQMLMNARARSEAVRLMDAGDFAGTQQVLRRAAASSHAAFAAMPASAETQEEMNLFAEYDSSLGDRSSDKMSRKRLLYDLASRRRSQKLS